MIFKRRDWFKQLGSVAAWLALPLSAKAAVAAESSEIKNIPLVTIPPPDPGAIRESYELICLVVELRGHPRRLVRRAME